MNILLAGAEVVIAATFILLATRAWAGHVENASLRHLVRLSGLVALVFLPLFAALLPSEFVVRAGTPEIVGAPASPGASISIVAWFLVGLAALWLAGMFALSVRGLVGAYAFRAIVRRAKPHPFPAATLVSWAACAGFYCDWRLRLSTEIQTPISGGLFKPAVVLPEQCTNWAPFQLDAAMLHELAHLRRRDSLCQAIAMLCCGLYWPHPLVWAEAKALRADAEHAADDAVIASGIRQSDYADLLLRVATGMREHSFIGLEFFMIGRGGLEARIRSVLTSHSSRSGVTRMQILKTVLFGTATALALALARPSLADMQPAAPQEAEHATPTVLPPPVTQSELPPATSNNAVAEKSATRSTTRHARRVRRMSGASPVDAARIGEAVAKAVNAAHLGDVVAKAVNEAHIDQAVAKATDDAQIGANVSAALAEAHIDEKVAAAMKAVQPKIDAAVAQAQRAAQAAQQAAPTSQPTPAQ